MSEIAYRAEPLSLVSIVGEERGEAVFRFVDLEGDFDVLGSGHSPGPSGSAEEILQQPKNPYTRELLSAVPELPRE